MSKHTKRKKSGQGLVEFAIVLPVLLLILVGTLEFARVLFIYSNLFNATREGVRYGVTNPRDFDGIRDAIAGKIALVPVNPVDNPFDPEGVWIIVEYDSGPGTPTHQEVDYVATGDRVHINVRYNIKALTPLMAPFFTADGFVLDSNATRTIQTVGVIVNPPPTAPPGYGGGGGGGGQGGNGPSITLDPECGPIGSQTLTINGSGWDSDNRVDVYADGTKVLNNVSIDPVFSLTITVNSTQAGNGTIRVVGRQSGSEATATYYVPCDAPPTDTPTPTATPTPTETPTATPTPTETPTSAPTSTPAPAQIVIDTPVPAGQTSVTGSAEPGETVALRIVQTGVLVSVVVDSNGHFLFSNLSPLLAGSTLIVQGYGQQDTAIVEGALPTATPTPGPNPNGYIEITPNCGPSGTQTITVNGYNWPSGYYLTIYFDTTKVYDSGTSKIRTSTFEQTFTVSNVAAGIPHTVKAQAWSRKYQSGTLAYEYEVPFGCPCPVPDLVVSGLQLATTLPIGTYQKVDVEVQVTNQGGADIPSLFWVDLFADTDPDPYTYAGADYVAINGLPAGTSINFSMWVDSGFATTGEHTLVALVDTWNQVLETDETNNTSTPLSVTVSITNPIPTPTPTPEVPPGPAGTISGITYMDGVPQSLVNVYIYNSQGRLIWSGFSNTITTPNGTIIDGYYEAELPAGNYTVIGQMRMATAIYWGQVTVADLQPGEIRQEVDINLTILE